VSDIKSDAGIRVCFMVSLLGTLWMKVVMRDSEVDGRVLFFVSLVLAWIGGSGRLAGGGYNVPSPAPSQRVQEIRSVQYYT